MSQSDSSPGDVPDSFVGVISDTHGVLRPEAIECLNGAELIVHAGDVGRREILQELEQIAPVVAVRGNVDRLPGVRELPQSEVVEFGDQILYIIHILEEIDIDAKAAGMAAVIFGHSHQPKVEREGEVLYLNPGSAGPRRFSLPVTVARLYAVGDRLEAEIVDLEV